MSANEPARWCPRCAARLRATDPRYVSWCVACDWNVSPALSKAPDRGRLARWRHGFERRLVRSLFEDWGRRSGRRTRFEPSTVVAWLLAGLVHLVALALLSGGIWLVATTWSNPLAWVLGAAMAGLGFLMRPRAQRLPDDLRWIERSDAPVLYAAVDRVADELGVRGAGRIDIAIDGGIDASLEYRGLRRRTVLLIGLPFWKALGPQERVAVLGHELGHQCAGDLRRGWVLGSALEAVARVRWAFTHDWNQAAVGWVSVSTRIVLGGFAVAARAFGWVLLVLTLRSNQRAEYHADELGARLGTRAAMAGALRTLLAANGLQIALETAVRRGETDLWSVGTAYAAGLPELERERQLRADALADHRIDDDTHPPTHLRLAALRARPDDGVGRVVLSNGESRAIDAELAPLEAPLARAFRDEVRAAVAQ